MKVSKLLFICIIIFLCSCSKEKKYWEAVVKYNTIESYKSYISNFPNGKYKDKADSCIQVLIWTDAKRSNIFEAYEKYLNCYPKGYFKLQADSLFEETLWESANTSLNMEYFIKYRTRFPSGKHILGVKNQICKYLIESEHVGFFKIGMQLPTGNFNGFSVSQLQKKCFNVFAQEQIVLTKYYAYENKEKSLEFVVNDNNEIIRIIIISDNFRTSNNISVNSSINEFIEKFPQYLVTGHMIDTDTSEDEYFYLFAKGENGVEFEISSNDVIEGDGIKVRNVNNGSKIKGIQVCHKEEDEYSSILKSCEEENVRKAKLKQEEERQTQALKESQASRSSQNNSSSSKNNNNSYNRSYRDNFESRSAVFEFLANHTFKGSDGARITYDMSTLSLTFPSGKSALFTNVELLGYNQNIARIRAICTNVSGYSATFTLNASSGTVTDNDGTLYRAVN